MNAKAHLLSCERTLRALTFRWGKPSSPKYWLQGGKPRSLREMESDHFHSLAAFLVYFILPLRNKDPLDPGSGTKSQPEMDFPLELH